MSNVIKSSQALLEFIDIHNVADETNYDSGGQPYGARSKHFGYLIDKAREELEKLAQLPYPLSAEIIVRFGENKNRGLSLDEKGITYIARIRAEASEKLSKELLDAD
jgi:hypothetical protein